MIAHHPRKLPPYFTFPHLGETASFYHGVFGREGGVSQNAYARLNIAATVGDRPEHVAQNRRRVARCFPGATPLFVRQVHGDRVLKITAPFLDGQNPEADAMVTDRPGLLLVVQAADCQPVLLADPVRRVTACVHSGWRGSILNIVGRTAGIMVSDYGCRPGNILAGIGPSLGPCCAEFVHYRRELPETFLAYRDGGNRFDFWALTRDQLRAEGVAAANIQTSGLCTRCRTDLFFSYRKEKTTGRFATVIGLKE